MNSKRTAKRKNVDAAAASASTTAASSDVASSAEHDAASAAVPTASESPPPANINAEVEAANAKKQRKDRNVEANFEWTTELVDKLVAELRTLKRDGHVHFQENGALKICKFFLGLVSVSSFEFVVCICPCLLCLHVRMRRVLTRSEKNASRQSSIPNDLEGGDRHQAECLRDENEVFGSTF